jgi:hypothetical protein
MVRSIIPTIVLGAVGCGTQVETATDFPAGITLPPLNCRIDSDCPEGRTACVGDGCIPVECRNDSHCDRDFAFCLSYRCVEYACQEDGDCPRDSIGLLFCNRAARRCQRRECLANTDCPESGGRCIQGQCRDAECEKDADCSGDLNRCIDLICTPVECIDDGDCPGPRGICTGSMCRQVECVTNFDCPPNWRCVANECQPLSPLPPPLPVPPPPPRLECDPPDTGWELCGVCGNTCEYCPIGTCTPPCIPTCR